MIPRRSSVAAATRASVPADLDPSLDPFHEHLVVVIGIAVAAVAFVLFLVLLALIALSLVFLAFSREVVDGAAAIAVVLDWQGPTAAVVPGVVVRVGPGDNADDIIVAVAVICPRADLRDPVFQQPLLPAMVVDLS